MTQQILKMDPNIVADIIDDCAKGTVGKLLKRIEICIDNVSLKAQARELIYEDYRALKSLLMVHAKSIAVANNVLTTRVVEFKSEN